MRVEVWSDIICPWCGLGLHRLKAALGRFEHGSEVEVVHHSFQLDERAPAGQTESVRSMLQKKGLPDAQIDSVTARVAQLAKAEGLEPYHVLDNRVGNTSLAHELAAWATELGRGNEMWDLLFESYFGAAESIFDLESLLPLAAKLKLDPSSARDALSSRRYAKQVSADGRAAHELGANGVPFFVLDHKLAIGGAQSVDVLLQALEKAWTNRSSARA